jgi:hypothetical protein
MNAETATQMNAEKARAEKARQEELDRALMLQFATI